MSTALPSHLSKRFTRPRAPSTAGTSGSAYRNTTHAPFHSTRRSVSSIATISSLARTDKSIACSLHPSDTKAPISSLVGATAVESQTPFQATPISSGWLRRSRCRETIHSHDSHGRRLRRRYRRRLGRVHIWMPDRLDRFPLLICNPLASVHDFGSLSTSGQMGRYIEPRLSPTDSLASGCNRDPYAANDVLCR